MAGENEAADATATIEEPGDDLDSDFEAGFTGSATGKTETPAPGDADEDPAGKPAATPAAAASTTDTPAATAETPPATAAKKVEIDEAELAALRQKAGSNDEAMAGMQRKFDQVFGQVGSLKQAIDKLRTETPAGEKIEIDESDFKELSETYPELAKFTLQGLNKALAKMRGTGGADPAAVDKIVTERVQALSTEVMSKVTDGALNAILPRWRQQVNTPAFTDWLKTQPSEVQVLAQSDDLGDAAEMLTLFRDTRRAAATPPPAPKPPAASAAQAAAKPTPRQRQIAAAVTPRGDGAALVPGGTTEDDDFEAGFKAGKV